MFAFEELAFYSKEMKILGVYPAHPFRATFEESGGLTVRNQPVCDGRHIAAAATLWFSPSDEAAQPRASLDEETIMIRAATPKASSTSSLGWW